MIIALFDGMNCYRTRSPYDPGCLSPREFYMESFEVPADLQVWVWEGRHSLSSRREIFPDYKGNRDRSSEEDIYSQIELFREVMTHSKAHQVAVEGFEADDVIAALAKKFALDGHFVQIYSADYDFAQLVHHKNIVCGFRPKKNPIPPQQVRLFKTLVGDPSDNIKGIPRIGEKKFSEIPNKLDVQKMFESETYDQKVVDAMQLTKTSAEWVKDNFKLLVAYWRIIGFLHVEMDEINANWITGVPNFRKGDELLREFLL